MLEVVNRKAKKHGWKNVETKLLDGGDLNGASILHDPLSTSTAPRPTDHPTQCMGSSLFPSKSHSLPLSQLSSTLTIDTTQGISSASITHAFACTYIDLAHNATACIQELHRVIAPGGILGINTWAEPTHPSISIPWTKACQKLHPGYKAPLVTSPK